MNKIIIILLLSLSILGCEQSQGTDNGGNFFEADPNRTGQGGSLARFTIAKGYLYTVDFESLNVFSLGDPRNPEKLRTINLNKTIETIFTREDLLFIGTREGMIIMSIENPDLPKELSFYDHVYSCDPVVANDKYAFVSIRSDENSCRFGINALDVVDIQDPTNPILVKSYFRTNPIGLSLSGNSLYLCDNGIWRFNIDYPDSLEEYSEQVSIRKPFDLISNLNYLYALADEGVYIFADENGQLQELALITLFQK